MTTKQVFGSFGNQDETCGIGAAQVAFGDDPGSSPLISILGYPLSVTLPCCGAHKPSIQNAIIHLNDVEEWPRQKIADWLESEGL